MNGRKDIKRHVRSTHNCSHAISVVASSGLRWLYTILYRLGNWRRPLISLHTVFNDRYCLCVRSGVEKCFPSIVKFNQWLLHLYYSLNRVVLVRVERTDRVRIITQ